ncbi:LptF/LptG family permease [bacterium]|nr:LptF/LptG family permease [bacterium]MBR6462152.1 LptF/LptG family permease [bacterium]
MKLIDRYLIKSFFLPLFYCLAAFLVLFFAYDMTNNLSDFLEEEKTVSEIATFYVMRIPEIFSIVMPFAVLLAILYCLGNLSRTNEIIAMRASGIALTRIIRPYLCCALLITLGTFALSEYCGPVARKKAQEIMPKKASTLTQSISQGQNSTFVTFENTKKNRIWNLQATDEPNKFRYISIRHYKPSTRRIIRQLEAESAEYIANYGWYFFNVKEIIYDADEKPKDTSTYKKRRISVYDETPEIIFSHSIDDEMNMNLSELKNAARTVKEESSRYYSLKADLHRRYAMPFACFVFVLLAAPFGIFHTRAGMMKGVLTSIILCLGYFVVAYLLINLAKEGKVNAIVACWSANVVFLGIGAYLVYRMR